MILSQFTLADFWINLGVGVLGSILASVVFLYFILAYLRPHIKISPNISKTYDEQFKQFRYSFKIINYSKHSAYDLKCDLVALKKIPVDGSNMNVRMTPVSLREAYLDYLPKYATDKKCKPFAQHAQQFKSFEAEIETILRDEKQSLQFSLTAKHGLTGLSKHFKMEFATIDVLKDSRFKFGNNLETV